MHDRMTKTGPAHPSLEIVTDKIKLLAERKPYGVVPKGVVGLEDGTDTALWHWEVLSVDLLPEEHRSLIKSSRADRVKVCDRAGEHSCPLSC